MFAAYEETFGLLSGKNTSSGAESASRSLLFDTAFRYDPEKEDIEGIIPPPSPISPNPPDSTPLRSVPHNVSGQVSVLSSLHFHSSGPSLIPANAVGSESLGDERVGDSIACLSYKRGSPLRIPLMQMCLVSRFQIVEDEDSGLGLKNLQEAPSPPPQPTPQHQANPVKDLVSRLVFLSLIISKNAIPSTTCIAEGDREDSNRVVVGLSQLDQGTTLWTKRSGCSHRQPSLEFPNRGFNSYL